MKNASLGAVHGRLRAGILQEVIALEPGTGELCPSAVHRQSHDITRPQQIADVSGQIALWVFFSLLCIADDVVERKLPPEPHCPPGPLTKTIDSVFDDVGGGDWAAGDLDVQADGLFAGIIQFEEPSLGIRKIVPQTKLTGGRRDLAIGEAGFLRQCRDPVLGTIAKSVQHPNGHLARFCSGGHHATFGAWMGLPLSRSTITT